MQVAAGHRTADGKGARASRHKAQLSRPAGLGLRRNVVAVHVEPVHHVFRLQLDQYGVTPVDAHDTRVKLKGTRVDADMPFLWRRPREGDWRQQRDEHQAQGHGAQDPAARGEPAHWLAGPNLLKSATICARMSAGCLPSPLMRITSCEMLTHRLQPSA